MVESEPRVLTLLKAVRIVHDLDPDLICSEASISRSYLARLENGAAPSPNVAAKLTEAIRSGSCKRSRPLPIGPIKTRELAEANALIERMKLSDIEFRHNGLREIHVLYPDTYSTVMQVLEPTTSHE